MSKCEICGRPSLPGGKLCPDCRAARKRAFAATVTQPLLAAASKSGGRLLRPSQSVAATVRRAAEQSLFVKPPPPKTVRRRSARALGVAASLAVMLALGAYSLHRILPAKATQASAAPPSNVSEQQAAAAAISVTPTLTASKPQGETQAIAAPIPAPATAIKAETGKRAGARQRVGTAASAPAPLLEQLSAASGPALVLESPAPPRPDRWEAMNESLAKCVGGLWDRVVCDFRVRQQYCADHWGKVPQCPSPIAGERGQ